MSKTWADFFRELDQWDEVGRFEILQASELNTVSGFRRLCSPKIGHLLLLRGGGVQAVHHIHQDVEDELHAAENSGDLWALTGAGSTASTIVIENSGTYDRQSGAMIEWDEMRNWISADDVTSEQNKDAGRTGQSKEDGLTKPKKQASKRSTVGGRTRATKTPTSKMQEYRKVLMVDSSDEEEASVGPEGPGNDENDDPVVTMTHQRVTIPNILPVPAFIFAAIMESYTTNASRLCVATIAAIKARTIQADEDPEQSLTAKRASYVARWLWNVATAGVRANLGHTVGVITGPVLNPRADIWARDTHLRHLATRASVARTSDDPMGAPTNAVWTNLANALALQVTERASTAAPAAKKGGFDAFPSTTQQMVLFATQRNERGEAATEPVATYVEILDLANAAYVAQHLHHHLKTRLGLDVWLPSGFCSAVRIASFISTSVDRPEAFSLFACGPQPLAKKNPAGTDDSTETADDLMRMQLKVTDSTTGLSDKDVKRLTQIRHTVPRDFRELSGLIENMSGVTELIFGLHSPITTMLTSWVHFLTKTGGTTVALLRQLAAVDATMPSRLGWFIERRIQQFLVACASCEHIDLIDPGLFDFTQARQQLVDGMFQFPICPYLKAKLGGEGSTAPGAVSSRGGATGRPGYADDVATNPNGRLVKITSKDNWQTFVDHASEAPIPNLCCRYHLNGRCVKSCFHASTHVVLTEEQKAGLTAWVAKCRSRMRSNQDDGDKTNKKSKVTTRDHAYSLPSTRTHRLAVDTSSVHHRHAEHKPPLAGSLDSRSPLRASLSSTPPRLAVVTTPRRLTTNNARNASPAARSPAAIMHASRIAGHVAMASISSPPRRTVAVSPPALALAASYPSGLAAGNTPGGPPQLLDAPNLKSKYPSVPHVPFPKLRSPDAVFPVLPLPHLPALLDSILSLASPRTRPTDFVFDWTPAATTHNLATLRRFELSWSAALAVQPFSTLTPGSEFRSADALAPLLSRHPLWRRFRERVTGGAEFPLFPIDEIARRADVTAVLARGNHKSARGHEAKLLNMLQEEVRRGWQLPLPKEAALELPDCEVAPLGVTEQYTINEDGERVPKLRLTHDQSFNATKGEKRSVNDRVDTSKLTPARFGRAMMRLLHSVSFLRRRFPQERLLITKVDCKSAYRRIHLQPNTAAKSCTCIAGVLLMALRMTFGGSPNPSQWSDVSEVIADLANDLVRREDWDETEWRAPQQELLSSDKAIDNDRGFISPGDSYKPAFEMSIDVSARDDYPTFDCYLDDMFGVGRECDQARLEAAVPFALHLVGRPATDDESFPRDGLLSESKFLAEAKASERKIILGWVVNTREFTVSLPMDKYRAWLSDLRRIKGQPGRRANSKDLEATIGRLNHAAFVVPNSRSFLGRLYRASERAQDYGSVRLSQAQVEDLELWERFLADAARGISINRLVCRWPTRVVRVDACPQGLGGYGLQSGVAWRMRLGPDIIGRGSLNALEFLAALIGVWVEHQLGPELAADDVLLSQGDSTSATGWMAKSSFGDECPVLLAVARELASYLAEHGLTHYSQWFPGKENSVADALSRDFELSDEEIVSLVRENFAEQVPQSFRIVPLPETVISSVGSLLRLQPKTQQLPTTPVPSEAAAGKAAIREGFDGCPGFAAGGRARRQAGTVRAALDDVAQAYRANKLVSPIHDTRGRLDTILAAQLRSYTSEDPETRRPQAIPAAVVAIVANADVSEVQRAVGQLVVGAFFFAMRSCEYSEVTGSRRTQVIRIGDLDFRKDGRIVDVADAHRLQEADTVSVTYRSQKNGERGVTVTQHRTVGSGQGSLCPVRSFADLVTRVSQYELNDHKRWALAEERPINLVVTGERAILISSNQVIQQLRAGALLYGEERLGFTTNRIGTHSLRSGAATAMFLAGVPTETIQMIGRWKSQAFLRYIRIQVQQLTQGVASGMIEHSNFFTIGQRK